MKKIISRYIYMFNISKRNVSNKKVNDKYYNDC